MACLPYVRPALGLVAALFLGNAPAAADTVITLHNDTGLELIVSLGEGWDPVFASFCDKEGACTIPVALGPGLESILGAAPVHVWLRAGHSATFWSPRSGGDLEAEYHLAGLQGRDRLTIDGLAIQILPF